MAWKILSVVGERWRLIKALLRREKSVSYWCGIFGISRKTAYKWKQRFIQDGRRGLRDRPRKPKHIPHRLPGKWIRRIAGARLKYPYWGPKKIRAWFLRQGWHPPTERTIARWLTRQGLTRKLRRRPTKAGVRLYPTLTVAQRPNQVWTVDFKGWFRTGNGQRCEPLTVRDLFSRYGLLVRLLPDQRWIPVRAVFTRLFRQWGMPEVIRVDNGGPFASSGPAGFSHLSVWWVRLGIRVEFTRPAHPEDNGAHEQFHRVLKCETTNPVAWTPRGQQHRTTLWLRDYNQVRPHEAIGQKVPGELYRRSPRHFLKKLPELKYPLHFLVRRIRSNGEIRWNGGRRFIGEAFIGQRIGLRPIGPGLHAVYFARLLIGHLHDRDPGAMRPMVYRHRHAVSKKHKL